MTQLTLKMLRVRNNWTQEQAAKKVGVSKESRSWYQVLKEQNKNRSQVLQTAEEIIAKG